jgi:hypothetical protein
MPYKKSKRGSKKGSKKLKLLKITKSPKKDKKLRASFERDGRIKNIDFGSAGMSDFTKHKNTKRRHNYLTRSGKIKGDWKKHKYSANNLSRKILW